MRGWGHLLAIPGSCLRRVVDLRQVVDLRRGHQDLRLRPRRRLADHRAKGKNFPRQKICSARDVNVGVERIERRVPEIIGSLLGACRRDGGFAGELDHFLGTRDRKTKISMHEGLGETAAEIEILSEHHNRPRILALLLGWARVHRVGTHGCDEKTSKRMGSLFG
jgi:hypothetical protein